MLAQNLKLNDMLNSLPEEDYKTVVDFVEYLTEKRKKECAKQSQALLDEIQTMFANDKGWQSEDEMLADMAKFRKERLGI